MYKRQRFEGAPYPNLREYNLLYGLTEERDKLLKPDACAVSYTHLLPVACITAPIQAIQRENTGSTALSGIPNGYAVNVYVKPPWS